MFRSLLRFLPFIASIIRFYLALDYPMPPMSPFKRSIQRAVVPLLAVLGVCRSANEQQPSSANDPFPPAISDRFAATWLLHAVPVPSSLNCLRPSQGATASEIPLQQPLE
jgi:hypothetical protein